MTFTDGSKLDLIEAGRAYASHLASVPGATGEQSVATATQNSAPTGLTYASAADAVGFEWHSAADFGGVEGLKLGVSAAFGDDGEAIKRLFSPEFRNRLDAVVSFQSLAPEVVSNINE